MPSLGTEGMDVGEWEIFRGSEPAWEENSGSSWCYTNVLSFYRFVASFFVCIVKVQSRVGGSVARAEGGKGR